MKRLIGGAGQLAVDRDEIARSRGLARDDDLVLPQSALEGERRRFDRREHHALVEDLFRGETEIAVGVLLHPHHDQLLIERAAVDADAHRLAVVDRDFADRRELLVAPFPGADVARIDAVLVERGRALGIPGQEQVAVVVEVADERRLASGVEHPPLDLGHRGGGLGEIDRDPHHVGSGFGKLDALLSRGSRVGGIGHRHRLHDDRRAAANLDATDFHAHALVQPDYWHRFVMIASTAMRTVLVREFGGPDVLRVEEVAPLVPGAAEVVVRVRASGVNPVDAYIRSGTYVFKPSLPYVPGGDGAGEVEAVGADVQGFAPGDRVYIAGDNVTLIGAGTCAEQARCSAAMLHRLPTRVSFAQGAAMGVPYGTAYRSLFVRANARAGETVFVHGATGGVGIASIQLARAHGMRVFGSGGTESGLQLLRDQGVDWPSTIASRTISTPSRTRPVAAAST